MHYRARKFVPLLSNLEKPLVLTILFLAALGSSIISGLVGMAGGVTLLAVLTFFFPMSILVPIHGTVQFASNVSRSFILKAHIQKESFIPFLMGVPFGAVGVYFLLKAIPTPQWALIVVTFLLFYVAFKPKKLPELRLGSFGFFILGGTASFLGALIGATGPLLAPFFARSDFEKEEIVATKSACQILVHLVKFPIFITLAFPYQDYAIEIGLMVFGVIVGTKIGTSLLKRVSTQWFMVFLKVALALTGLRLGYKMLTHYNVLP